MTKWAAQDLIAGEAHARNIARGEETWYPAYKKDQAN